MKKLSYSHQGDLCIPNLLMPPQPEAHMGHYARLRLQYLKEHRRVLYLNLLTSCKLASHLSQVEENAATRMKTLVGQMAQAQQVDETLKVYDQMRWVGLMNNIRNAAEEMVLKEIVYD